MKNKWLEGDPDASKYDGPELSVLVALARRAKRKPMLSVKEFELYYSMLRTKQSLFLAKCIAGFKTSKSKDINLKVEAIKILAYGLPDKKKPAKVKHVCPCCRSAKP